MRGPAGTSAIDCARDTPWEDHCRTTTTAVPTARTTSTAHTRPDLQPRTRVQRFDASVLLIAAICGTLRAVACSHIGQTPELACREDPIFAMARTRSPVGEPHQRPLSPIPLGVRRSARLRAVIGE